jgi:hypothetical protein
LFFFIFYFVYSYCIYIRCVIAYFKRPMAFIHNLIMYRRLRPICNFETHDGLCVCEFNITYHALLITHVKVNINILPLVEGVMVDYHTRKKYHTPEKEYQLRRSRGWYSFSRVWSYKHAAFNWWCYGRLPHSENQYHPRRSRGWYCCFLSVVIYHNTRN